MAKTIRIPVTNQVMGNNFTLKLAIGPGAVPADVMLDTGSSMLTVDGSLFDAAAVTTTQLLQTAQFSSGTLMASVVNTAIGLSADGAPAAITVPKANLAAVYDIQPGLFGRADGILGLAYPPLNQAYQMPANTWDTHYKASQLSLGTAAPNLAPYVNQAVSAGLITDSFAFSIRRSAASEGPNADVLNTGVFVLGDGTTCKDLYSGAFTSVAVVHDTYYSTNLISIQVGQRTIPVPPVAAGSTMASNAVVDSGNSSLMLDPDVYRQVIAAFNAINPIFGTALTSSASYDQTALQLAAWPPLRFVMQGANGAPATIAVAPQDYWQFDSDGPGKATTGLAGTSPHPNQSILGLPLMTGYFVVFDRTAGNGLGTINFAAHPAAAVA